MKRENLPWFLSSAVLVAVSQAFVYASLAVAPLMVVTPIGREMRCVRPT